VNLFMQQATHIVLNCLCACKHSLKSRTQIRGGKQTRGLGCTILICYRRSAPVPSGRNLCPLQQKAEKYQLAAITSGSSNTSKGQRSMQDCGTRHQCFSRFSGVVSSVFWLLGLAQSTAAPRPSSRGRCTRDPELLPTKGTMQLLCSAAKDLNDHHRNCLFIAFHAPFQDAVWKPLINGQIFALKLVSLV